MLHVLKCRLKILFITIFIFLQGVGPTSQRAGVIAGVELPVYDFSKKQLINETKLMQDGPYAHFV